MWCLFGWLIVCLLMFVCIVTGAAVRGIVYAFAVFFVGCVFVCVSLSAYMDGCVNVLACGCACGCLRI